MATIRKVIAPDGTQYDISSTTTIIVFERSDGDVNWKVGNFSGSTTLISGTTDDYQLNMQTS